MLVNWLEKGLLCNYSKLERHICKLSPKRRVNLSLKVDANGLLFNFPKVQFKINEN